MKNWQARYEARLKTPLQSNGRKPGNFVLPLYSIP